MRMEPELWDALDGRMFAMYHTGAHFEQAYPGKISDSIKAYMNRLFALMASGATTTSLYSRGVLKFMARIAKLQQEDAACGITLFLQPPQGRVVFGIQGILRPGLEF